MQQARHDRMADVLTVAGEQAAQRLRLSACVRAARDDIVKQRVPHDAERGEPGSLWFDRVMIAEIAIGGDAQTGWRDERMELAELRADLVERTVDARAAEIAQLHITDFLHAQPP